MSKAFLWGLNYSGDCKLNGCINDVKNMVSKIYAPLGIPCQMYNDQDNYAQCTRAGLTKGLKQMVAESWKLKEIYWHYSGHGSSRPDKNGDEKDGKDELLVPADYQKAGCIPDDELYDIFTKASPNCEWRILFDCCHSATMLDLLYRWDNRKKPTVENIHCALPSKILTISGCLDSQTSADALIDDEYAGALTAVFIETLKECKSNNVFDIVDRLTVRLKEDGYSQIPKLCSTYNLAQQPEFFPSKKKSNKRKIEE
jgi:hypothetical protein